MCGKTIGPRSGNAPGFFICRWLPVERTGGRAERTLARRRAGAVIVQEGLYSGGDLAGAFDHGQVAGAGQEQG